ncbi:phage antirepressor KilAC domain-containing protein [Desulfofarcimen acetoxidans]|uniref:phage antirepressor KilAC domain-containing protein n=1 Tax=Desulfofarcimen acetoxidans TaxID=58138 RepID=UPI00019E52B2|nr:phage antirepressor KilAC domain-containing protein [Desulfofarcimen acetoxidans]
MVPDLKYAPSLTIIPRRAILRIGMLLRDSEVAKTVRSYLLNVEERASATQRQQAMEDEINRFKEAFFTPDNLRNIAATMEENVSLKKENQLLIEEVKVLTPKANRFDSFLSSKNSHRIGVMANTFGIPGLGQNNMFQYLRDKNILFKKNGVNQPYRKYIEAGYFDVIWSSVNSGNMEVAVTLVTPKGVNFIFGELVKDGYIDEYGEILTAPEQEVASI